MDDIVFCYHSKSIKCIYHVTLLIETIFTVKLLYPMRTPFGEIQYQTYEDTKQKHLLSTQRSFYFTNNVREPLSVNEIFLRYYIVHKLIECSAINAFFM